MQYYLTFVPRFHLILYKVEQEPEHPNVNGPGAAADPVCGQSARFPRQERKEGIKGNILHKDR